MANHNRNREYGIPEGCSTAYLRGAVGMRDDLHNVIQWQEGVTVDFCEDILSLCAVREQTHQLNVVLQRTANVIMYWHVVAHQAN